MLDWSLHLVLLRQQCWRTSLQLQIKSPLNGKTDIGSVLKLYTHIFNYISS